MKYAIVDKETRDPVWPRHVLMKWICEALSSVWTRHTEDSDLNGDGKPYSPQGFRERENSQKAEPRESQLTEICADWLKSRVTREKPGESLPEKVGAGLGLLESKRKTKQHYTSASRALLWLCCLCYGPRITSQPVARLRFETSPFFCHIHFWWQRLKKKKVREKNDWKGQKLSPEDYLWWQRYSGVFITDRNWGSWSMKIARV